jgi:hypothetical protein
MRTITKDQLKAVHTLLGKIGITDKEEKKKEIIAYTGGRTDSSRAMTFTEAEQMIATLMSLDPAAGKAEKMRKKILSLAHEMGWKKPNGKINMDHVNQWCIKYGYLHKKLDDYTYKELPQLVTQFTNAYKDYIKKV